MKILFVAGVNERVNGAALASQVLVNDLRPSHEVKIIDLKKRRFKNKYISFLSRIKELIAVFIRILFLRFQPDVVYFVVSESLFGNLKDLMIFFLCRKWASKFVVHLHGGAGMKEILSSKDSMLAKINLHYLNKVGAIIVLGDSLKPIYKAVKDQSKIHVVPNFSQKDLFVTNNVIERKFSEMDKLKILIVSNFLYGKGHLELLEGFLQLDETTKSKVEVHFAGEVTSKTLKEKLDKALLQYPQLSYHGLVSGRKKIELFQQSHVFCLPTYYPFEGQPISILEAYASGCVVLTTNHSGIFDVFVPGENGLQVQKKSSQSIAGAIADLLALPALMQTYASHNLEAATRLYTEAIYNQKVTDIISLVFEKNCHASMA